jgi:PEP-CTERM motif
MKKLFLVLMFCSAFLFIGNSAFAIPTLGVAPGAPGDTGLDTASFDGFPMSPSGGSLTIWYGNDSGGALDLTSDIWLLTTSANGDGFSFNGTDFSSHNEFTVASYHTPIYGVDLGNASSWGPLNQTFYSYDFAGKNFRYLNGDLDTGLLGAEVGDWMFAVLDNGGKILGGEFSPKTTSSTVTPEPATLLLLGGGLVGLAGFGRKRFKK